MGTSADEDELKPCIQDRLRSIITRARDIFEYLQILFLVILILGIITIPEILTLMIGREVIIPILSEIILENRFDIIFSIVMIFILLKQNKINKSFLIFEQERDRSIRRKEHDIRLIGEPLNSLRRSIKYYSDSLTYLNVNSTNGEIFIPRMNINDRLSPQQELLHEHFNTGDPQLFQSLYTYQESYNIIADKVYAIFKNCMDLLVQSWVTEKELITMIHSPNIFCAQIMNKFKEEVYNRLSRNDEPKYAHVENAKIIWFGSLQLNAMNGADANQIVSDINSILLGSEVYEEIKKLWEEAELLKEKREQIIKNIDHLIASVTAGIPLIGWCSVGIAANYEQAL